MDAVMYEMKGKSACGRATSLGADAPATVWESERHLLRYTIS